MLKRILSGVLAAALTLTALPLDAFAVTDAPPHEILYGDANGDGKIDSDDFSMLKRYIAEEKPSGFQLANADMDKNNKADLSDLLLLKKYLAENTALYGDVNCDGEIDMGDVLALKRYIDGKKTSGFKLENADVNGDDKADASDLLLLKRYLAEWNITLGPELLTVSFYDGDRLIDTLSAKKGRALGEVPDIAKSSKANAFLEGYYLDQAFTKPFYAEEPVKSNMKVYAKYADMPGAADLTPASFAQMDQAPDLSFAIKRTSGNVLPENAAELTVKDGSDPVAITVAADHSRDGVYIVSAPEGFHEGASYELTLADGWAFDGKEESIRTAAFSIAKDIVDQLSMGESTHFVQNNDPSALHAGSTVACEGAAVGDLICFYKSVSPQDRDYESGNAYLDDPEIWFKADAVSGDTVTLAELEEEDSGKMYDVPDNFPVKGSLPSADHGTLTLAADDDNYTLDTEFYAQMAGEGDASLEYAQSRINVGDFISIYPSTDSIDSASDVYFGKITGYDSASGTITYTKSSAEEIEGAADMYLQPALSGDDLVSEEAREEIESTVQKQVEDSGFAEEAAYMLADLAVKTESFRSVPGAEALITDEDGNALSDEQISQLNLGASFELKDGVKLKVEVITSGDQLHFRDKGAVQLGVGIDAQFEMDVEDNGKVMIDLSATFIQEIALGVTASGELVKKEILFIPVPIGVKVGSSVDVKSFTGLRIDAQAYTVQEEDKSLLDQLKDVINNPTKVANLLPDSLGGVKKGLEIAGDVMDKIEETKGKLEQVKDNAEKAKEYTQDLKTLWGVLEQVDGMPDEKQWNELGSKLGKTNISKDLMDMLNLSTETDLDADRYADSLNGLMSKYGEMLEKKTDWVKLVDKEMCRQEIHVKALVITLSANFIVRADMNIAMGASLQYEVGKRYTFWFKIGLFKPSAGSETMDLIDEQFAFQYYVMGRLGLKMGIRGKISLAIGSSKLADVGIAIELGPYVKLYGFFIYDYERTRAANSSQWVSSQRMAGALYMDFGLYLIVSFEAQALSLFEYNYDFVDKEYPLLEAGDQKYPYAFEYEPQEDEQVRIVDEDGNSSNGITMALPEEYRAMSYCNLTTGRKGVYAYDYDRYNFTFSNPNFSMGEDGKIAVTVPNGTRYMECDLTITYKYGKLAFSNCDIQVTVPLVWTNLSSAEIAERYTASVRVGNQVDGYETVWSKRVRKNQEFTLPTEDELMQIIGYDGARYSSFSFPDAGKKVSLIESTAYDCVVAYREYTITVNGIQSGDVAESRDFTTHYGETFDFSSLEGTGINSPSDDPDKAIFTRFANVTTAATVTANGQEQAIDLTQPVTGSVAQAIADGLVTAEANYVDDSANITFRFAGIDHADVTQKIKKGTTPSLSEVEEIVAGFATEDNSLGILDISPEVGNVKSSTIYQVICGKLEGPPATITFEENGGSDVPDITKVEQSFIGMLPVPEKRGYSLEGWYTDNGTFQNKFSERKMPAGGAVLYAKWVPQEYTVDFNVYGGDALDPAEQSKQVTFDSIYGSLPTPTRSGHVFLGWFTDAEAGEEVTAQTTVAVTAPQTLFAHWRQLKVIPDSTFDFGDMETADYEPGHTLEAAYTYQNDGEDYKEGEFAFRYMRQGSSEYEEGLPVNAGTYDITVSRPADDVYAKFEHNYMGVVTINRVARPEDHFDGLSIAAAEMESSYCSIRNIRLDPASKLNDYLSEDAHIIYTLAQSHNDLVIPSEGASSGRISKNEPADISWLLPGTEYALKVRIVDDMNYLDAESKYLSDTLATRAAPTEEWSEHTEEFTVINEEAKEITVESAAQLAYLAKCCNTNPNPYSGWTVNLAADLDLSAYKWTPIGNGQQYLYNTESGKLVVDRYCFDGIFNGNGHTIRGLYTTGYNRAGLFGRIYNAQVSDLTLADSYVHGGAVTGGIAGTMSSSRMTNCINDATVIGNSTGDAEEEIDGAGGLAGYIQNSRISGCVNNGRVNSVFQTGGIVGQLNGGTVVNNVNNGPVKGTDNHTGGIVGFIESGHLMNSANHGSVTGTSCVGGIAGQNEENGWILNCYTTGRIMGTNRYVGAVVGRNTEDKGAVHQVYYLRYSASCNGSNRNAAGSRDGSVSDDHDNLSAAWFTSPKSGLSRDADCGADSLINVLNNWVLWWNDGKCSAEWVAGSSEEYPQPTGTVNENAGTKQ